MYLGFPIMFGVLILSYFSDLILNVSNPWDPTNADGITIILLFWGVTAGLFISMNWESGIETEINWYFSIRRYRN